MSIRVDYDYSIASQKYAFFVSKGDHYTQFEIPGSPGRNDMANLCAFITESIGTLNNDIDSNKDSPPLSDLQFV